MKCNQYFVVWFGAGSDLLKEQLREIRSLRQRLEDSIQTNDRLRQQLEEGLVNQARDKGTRPPTHRYSDVDIF